ncbi:MAG: 50S ribosomal protein L14 [Patescibacteria group bacterium]|nr:50S ribosomal protein L14 [Patescibacteria group bacterium]
MIQPQSIVKIADNTGAKLGRVFKVLGSSKKRYAEIGELVILSVQSAEPRKSVKKKEICRALVIRQKKPLRRADGSYVRFDENAVVILEASGKDAKEPKGGRIFGPIPREISELGYQKIVSLAPEVV